jgi:hypothetical protein
MANLNKLKKYHFIYKTTNLLNGKFYVGMHSTNKLNDGYLGSGKRLKYSIKKYGKENFKLEILEFFGSRELLVEREKQLVNEDLLKDTNCMNLKPGGTGGFSLESAKKGAKKMNEIIWSDINFIKRHKTRWKKILKTNHLNKKYLYGGFRGKTHTEETKQKISEVRKGKGTGKANSQFGTRWITNGTENKKIKKEEIIPIGWEVGRVLRK